MTDAFPWPQDRVACYTAHYTTDPITIDGKLDEPCWLKAPRSPRFSDLVSGRRAIHDTRAAVLWNDTHLYVGYWIEEPDVRATYTERDSYIYEENDVEFFIAGQDSYYEFEINALGTIYEVLFIWEDAYLDEVPIEELFGRSAEKIAEVIVSRHLSRDTSQAAGKEKE